MRSQGELRRPGRSRARRLQLLLPAGDRAPPGQASLGTWGGEEMQAWPSWGQNGSQPREGRAGLEGWRSRERPGDSDRMEGESRGQSQRRKRWRRNVDKKHRC